VKKFLIMGALALGLVAMPRQEASAWVKCNFSVGLNWSWESANNSALWGLWRNGQVPGYPSDAWCCSPGSGSWGSGLYGMGAFPGYGPYGGDPGYGRDPGYGPPPHNGAPPYTAPAPTPAPTPAPKNNDNTPPPQASGWYGNSAYQAVGYYQAPSYYQSPASYYPSSNYYGGYSGYSGYSGYGGYTGYGYYGNSQVPSYWYGN
jgi:hypothetical protein